MSSLTDLAAEVSSRAAEVSRLLRELQLPEPTFKEDGLYAFDAAHSPAAGNEALRQARNALINATRDLSLLTMGPVDHLVSIGWSATDVSNLGILTRLQIPEKVPRHGSTQLSQLAQELKVPELIVSSAVRYAIGNGIFCEPEPGVIAHTAASARLAADPDMQNYSITCATEITELLGKMPETAVQKQKLQRDGPASASNVAYPDYANVFQYFQANPESAQRYFTFLAARSRIPRWSPEYLLSCWNWASVGTGTVVDVGGSVGLASLAIARSFPSISVVSQDHDENALREGEAMAKGAGLQDRIQFMRHDFFQPQPVTARAYIYKNILHDWPHADCVRIIKALLPALQDGAHVLVGESILPDPPATRASAWDERAIRVEEQLMVAAHGACERTIAQFQAIFKEASDKLHYCDTRRTSDGAFFSLIDYIYRA